MNSADYVYYRNQHTFLFNSIGNMQTNKVAHSERKWFSWSFVTACDSGKLVRGSAEMNLRSWQLHCCYQEVLYNNVGYALPFLLFLMRRGSMCC